MPKLFIAMMSQIRPHCVNMAKNVITSLRPTGSSKVKVGKAKSLSGDEMLPGWIQALGDNEGAQGDKVGNPLDEKRQQPELNVERQRNARKTNLRANVKTTGTTNG